jgi:hypothetical protein
VSYEQKIEAVQHARQAITDRATLVEAADPAEAGDLREAYDAARRHMRGEE